MNYLIEKGYIEELECGSNFAFLLNDNSYFLPTEYKVLQSQVNDHFVKCMKMMHNGKAELFYSVSSYKSLFSLIPSLEPEVFITIVNNLFAGIVDIKNNGFLSCKNIDKSLEHIFVDPNTCKVSLVYIPIDKHECNDDSAFENDLRSSLVRLIEGVNSLSSSPKVIQLRTDLQDGKKTIEYLAAGKQMSSNQNHKQNAPQSKNVTSGTGSAVNSSKGTLKLIGMNLGFNFMIEINKDLFVIGKKDTNDAAITFNKMISRIHCNVIRKNGLYYINDLQSSNGTFVNGKKVMPNQPVPLKDGDTVRLADVNFSVSIN